MSVLTEATGRGDVLLRRGVTNEFAVRWEQDSGAGFEPVDMAGWTAECVLRSPLDEVWLTLVCTTFADGLSIATFPASEFDAAEWEGRTHGNWFMNATEPGEEPVRLGDGYFYLEG